MSLRGSEKWVSKVYIKSTSCLLTIAEDQEERDIHADNGSKRIS